MLQKCLKTLFCSKYTQIASKKLRCTSICSDEHGDFVTPSDHCALQYQNICRTPYASAALFDREQANLGKKSTIACSRNFIPVKALLGSEKMVKNSN